MRFVDPRRKDIFKKGNMPRKGDVWLADMRFNQNAGHKVRPVLVLKRNGNDFTVAEITSKPARHMGDLSIMAPEYAGLERGSTVILSNRINMTEREFRNKLGMLSREDMRRVFRRYCFSKIKKSRP